MRVKIHLLKRVAGPEGNFPAGRTIEVSEVDANGLVSAGAAERIDKMVPYVQLTVDSGQLTAVKVAQTYRNYRNYLICWIYWIYWI